MMYWGTVSLRTLPLALALSCSFVLLAGDRPGVAATLKFPTPSRCTIDQTVFRPASAATGKEQSRPGGRRASSSPRSLVLVLDGARADAIEMAAMPNVAALIEGTWAAGYRGGFAPFAQTIKDAPTVSGPNHVSIYTGVDAAAHGVKANSGGQMSAVRQRDYLRLLEDDDPLRDTVKLFTWFYDGQIPSGADYSHLDTDQANVERAPAILAGHYQDDDWALGRDVDALFPLLDDADAVGHSRGWLGSSYLSELEKIDEQIGALLDAIKGRPNFASENWQILLTSDHGGYEYSHGQQDAARFTIPFLVASPSIGQGILAGVPSVLDVAPTVLQHFGVDPTANFLELDGNTTYQLHGTARNTVRLAHSGSLSAGMVVYLPFEDDLADATGSGNDAESIGKQKFSRGKFGRAVRLGRRHYVTIGSAADRPELDFGSSGGSPSWTITLWYRGRAKGHDPVLVGNKDWSDGSNAGLLLTANVTGKNEVGLNLADTQENRQDLYRIDASRARKWRFVAITFDSNDALATLFVGGSDGKLHYISNEVDLLGDLASSLPLNLGQDGTGEYPHALKARVDDVGMWRRALDRSEIESIYRGGEGVELATLTGFRS